MKSDPQASASPVPVRIELSRGRYQFWATVGVPNRPAQPRELVPLTLALADDVTSGAARQLAGQGRPVTCQKGCAACCRYLVHITQSEAYYLRDLVNRLPEPRRSQVRQRFVDAGRRLDEAGLLVALRHCQDWTYNELHEKARDYYALQVPCPFLEDESCSIYPWRPITCREYLVTSPAANCATVDKTGVRPVQPPVSFFAGLARFGGPAETAIPLRWVPLVLALEWADSHPDPSEPRPFPELLAELVAYLNQENAKR